MNIHKINYEIHSSKQVSKQVRRALVIRNPFASRGGYCTHAALQERLDNLESLASESANKHRKWETVEKSLRDFDLRFQAHLRFHNDCEMQTHSRNSNFENRLSAVERLMEDSVQRAAESEHIRTK